MHKVLLIAPDQTNVSWSSEVELLGGTVQVVALLGTVTLERVTRATSGQRYAAVHLAAHGSDAGVTISDGLLTRERLAQVARHVRADLVFLNACDSAALGQYLACQGVPCVICHTVAVADQDALRAAAYFYEELATVNGDFKKAFDKVNPCDGSFAWFAGANYVDAAILPVVAAVQEMRTQLAHTQRLLLTLLAAIGVVVAGALVALVVLASGVYAQDENPLSQPGRTIPQPVITRPIPIETPDAGGPASPLPTATISPR